jgi:hypothetical protein
VAFNFDVSFEELVVGHADALESFNQQSDDVGEYLSTPSERLDDHND